MEVGDSNKTYAWLVKKVDRRILKELHQTNREKELNPTGAPAAPAKTSSPDDSSTPVCPSVRSLVEGGLSASTLTGMATTTVCISSPTAGSTDSPAVCKRVWDRDGIVVRVGVRVRVWREGGGEDDVSVNA